MDKETRRWRMAGHAAVVGTLVIMVALSWAAGCLVVMVAGRCLGVRMSVKAATGIWLLVKWVTIGVNKLALRGRSGKADGNE